MVVKKKYLIEHIYPSSIDKTRYKIKWCGGLNVEKKKPKQNLQLMM